MKAFTCESGCFFCCLIFVGKLFCRLLFFSYLCAINHYKSKEMKRIIPILFVACALGSFTACQEKKKSDVIIAPKPVAPKPKQTQKMSGYEQSRDIQWLGSSYKVVVKREADTSLPLAQGDDNTKYYDNKIQVRILRSDGTEFFNHTFLKSEFTGYLDDNFKENGALLGIVYVGVDGDQLSFAASVGSPDVTSDEYVPLVVKISRMGAISIGKDTQLDTGSDDEKEKTSSDEDEV